MPHQLPCKELTRPPTFLLAILTVLNFRVKGVNPLPKKAQVGNLNWDSIGASLSKPLVSVTSIHTYVLALTIHELCLGVDSSLLMLIQQRSNLES